jgi:hypothetical protein
MTPRAIGFIGGGLEQAIPLKSTQQRFRRVSNILEPLPADPLARV